MAGEVENASPNKKRLTLRQYFLLFNCKTVMKR
jgi:hypothetical protein